MNWRKQKRMNMEMANANLLKETHEHSDAGKIEYIQEALKNLTSEDLDKVYLMVEELDPEYDNSEKNFNNIRQQTYNWAGGHR
jgi:hypothetical protein